MARKTPQELGLDNKLVIWRTSLTILDQRQTALQRLPSQCPRAFVVTGPARSLYGLVTSLRKPIFSTRFLVVGVPCHNGYLVGQTEKIIAEDLDGEEASNPRRMRRHRLPSLPARAIHWSAATNFLETTTHTVDFGPGGLSGIGLLTARNPGVRVIVVGDRATKGDAELSGSQSVKYDDWWTKQFSPRLVKTSDGWHHVYRHSRLASPRQATHYGRGHDSFDCSSRFQLASGGHYTNAALRSKVAEIQAKIPAGVVYINQRQFGFQLPLWQELPVEGFCVAAGILSTEKAADIIRGLRLAGIRHVAFKPGSVDRIRQVVAIAAANADFPIILQWTGGRIVVTTLTRNSINPFSKPTAQFCQQPNISLEKRAVWLLERRDEIIGKLNRDFSKLWFGWKKDGRVAKELGEMTYEETVLRMVRLMFVAHEHRWVDVSLRNLTGQGSG
ncbi:Fatty acid synthase [Mycena indigotica]|uniref:Fatty acid synthase n=1 Tax=Mycena indigotica TaxID=2126181 RepID=A0A8H6SYG9_9AGAR|nr:Fatty acid synthase [Mycena indigotica]KAF7307485.1 Fatty acid synthase [Mycena indigotica]